MQSSSQSASSPDRSRTGLADFIGTLIALLTLILPLLVIAHYSNTTQSLQPASYSIQEPSG